VAEPLDARLNAATVRLLGRPLHADERIGIAVSGGADSMALLSLAVRCWPGRVAAATVDHGLRAGSAAEADMVARWCAGAQVPHQILRPAAPLAGNLQAAARTARYALIESWLGDCGLAWLLTAHQADDQFETLLLRLNRGAGVAGLASVRARRGRVLRPLLGERRATLRDWCVGQGIPFVDDPSNEDARFDRVRMRQTLASNLPVDAAGLARSLDALAEADAALRWMTDRVAAQALRFTADGAVIEAAGLPMEILRRLLVRMIAHLNPEAEKPRGPSLDQALVQLLDARVVTLADCIVRGGDTWTARRAPARKMREPLSSGRDVLF
jgi:tRNA(Ile)-lysidine synthase